MRGLCDLFFITLLISDSIHFIEEEGHTSQKKTENDKPGYDYVARNGVDRPSRRAKAGAQRGSGWQYEYHQFQQYGKREHATRTRSEPKTFVRLQ